MKYLVRALPVWDEGGQREAPPAAVGASQRKFAAGVDNAHTFWTGSMEGEPLHFQKAGKWDMGDGSRKLGSSAGSGNFMPTLSICCGGQMR